MTSSNDFDDDKIIRAELDVLEDEHNRLRAEYEERASPQLVVELTMNARKRDAIKALLRKP